ncbi:MAG TPA: type IV pilus modification protein PilV [Gammaproteobacteria bacterium]|nr:type IV pilus modification protein PilV [Gammaproteobacteria bacterium]
MNMNINHETIAKRRSSGFTLIEVLVALVILSVGLLGIAGMITTALRTNDGAYLRTEANIMAYNILDRMRTNRDSATQGVYDSSMGTASDITPTPTSCLGSTANCTAAKMAAWDVYEWKQELAANLPSGEGSIVTSLDANGVVNATITVQWDAARAVEATKNTSTAASNTTSFTVTSGI